MTTNIRNNIYIAKFDIEFRPFATELNQIFNDLGYETFINGNTVTVQHYEENTIKDVLNIGNEFLEAKESVYESWYFFNEDNSDYPVINHYLETGTTQKTFY